MMWWCARSGRRHRPSHHGSSHMRHPSLTRRGIVAVASLALASTAAIGGVAVASTDAEPVSTPVTINTPDGQLMSYVVNARIANPGQTRLVETAVKAAGGVVVQSWPQIGVVIAHSKVSTFRADVVAKGGNAVESVGASRTVEVTEGTRNVLVGVLDSGIDPDHPDLAANIDVADSVNCTDAGRPDLSATGWYPTTSDHGTHVAGTIAAARNGVGIVGVAPNVRMAAVKVVNDAGFIYPEYAVCGFVWAGSHHMDVTNNSYYVDPFRYYCEDQPDQAAAKEAVRRAVDWSTEQGVVSSAAAGNEADDLANKTTDTTSPDDSTPITRTVNSGCHDIPTELDGVVTVASMQRFPAGTLDSRLSGFSNRGLGVIDVAAPGSSILSTIVAGNGYGLKSGTSMAGASCVGTPEDNSYFGEGVVDALDAVR